MSFSNRAVKQSGKSEQVGGDLKQELASTFPKVNKKLQAVRFQGNEVGIGIPCPESVRRRFAP